MLKKSDQELAWDKKRQDAEDARFTQQSVLEYGGDLGHAFAKYVLTGHDRSEVSAHQARKDFYTIVVKLLSNGTPDQKSLALQAMIEASELYIEKRIEAAMSNINPVY